MGCLHDPANVQQTFRKCIQNTCADAGRLVGRVNTLLDPVRRRRLKAFRPITDAKIIRLTRRRVAFFFDAGGAAVFRRQLRRG